MGLNWLDTLARLKEEQWGPLALQMPVRMEVVKKKRLSLAGS